MSDLREIVVRHTGSTDGVEIVLRSADNGEVWIKPTLDGDGEFKVDADDFIESLKQTVELNDVHAL